MIIICVQFSKVSDMAHGPFVSLRVGGVSIYLSIGPDRKHFLRTMDFKQFPSYDINMNNGAVI